MDRAEEGLRVANPFEAHADRLDLEKIQSRWKGAFGGPEGQRPVPLSGWLSPGGRHAVAEDDYAAAAQRGRASSVGLADGSPDPLLGAYEPARRPWRHQAEALHEIAGKEAAALFMAMRTGKTKVTIDDFGRMELRGKVSNLIVVAPGGVYETWADAYLNEVSDDLDLRSTVVTWRSGRTSHIDITEILRAAASPSRVAVFVVNVEALSVVLEARDLVSQILSLGPTMVVIDESTTIKNIATHRAEFISSIGSRAVVRRILTGLPTPKSPLDLFGQFLFLDPRVLGRRYDVFESRYAITRRIAFDKSRPKIKHKKVVGYQNLDVLREAIQPYVFRKRLEDCYDLPEKMYAIRWVEMTDQQKRIYEELKRFATAEIEGGAYVTATVVVAQMIRLHQVLCGRAVDEDGEAHEIAENRTHELMALLDDHDGKAIVWVSYDADVHRISSILQKKYGEGSAARFWGGNRSTRESEEARFRTDPDCLFMVATPAAGGRGREWSVADLVVYYSNTPDLEHRSQSEERAQAIGKPRPVLYVDLMTKGTVDERFIQCLRQKIDLAAAITGDNWREWVV